MIALWIWSGKKRNCGWDANTTCKKSLILSAPGTWPMIIILTHIFIHNTHTHECVYIYIFIYRHILSSSYFQHIHDNPVSKLGVFGAWIILSIHVTKTPVTAGSDLGVEGSLKNFVENCPEPKWIFSFSFWGGISVWECWPQSSDPNKSIGKW